MLHLLTRYRHLSLFIFFLFISLILLSLGRPALENVPKPSNILERAMLVVLQPFQRAVTSVISNTENIWNNYIRLVDVAKENNELRKQVLQLQEANNRYLEDLMAYERLKDTLHLAEDRKFSTILARVIGYDATNHSNTMVVDRGSNDGIQEGWPVITHAGIVGRTMTVAKNSTKVLLLSDPNCSVSALIQRTRDQGIVTGLTRKDAYTMKNVLRRAEIREGTIYRLTDQSLIELAKSDIPGYAITADTMARLAENLVPADVLAFMEGMQNKTYGNQRLFIKALENTLGKEQADWYKGIILQFSQADVLAALRPLKEQQFASKQAFIEALQTAIGAEQTAKYLEQILRFAREDETVISSGLGGLYPKGLIIGTVSKVKKDDYGLFQEIEITPSVDFSKLEEVLIIQRTEVNDSDKSEKAQE